MLIVETESDLMRRLALGIEEDRLWYRHPCGEIA